MDDLDAIGRCGAWTLTASDGAQSVAIPMRCRRWACERCGPAMRRRLVHLTSLTGCTRMLTLTGNPSITPDPYHMARRLSWAFGRLIAQARKRWSSEPIEYLAVWERHRSGFPHMHVALTGPYIPQRWISQQWQALTGAPIVDIRHLGSSGTTGRYLAKYLAKDPDPFLTGRAFRASRNFFPEPMRPQGSRACRLGSLNVYRDTVWQWLQDLNEGLQLVDIAKTGTSLARSWDSFPDAEVHFRSHWWAQRSAIQRRERPPPTSDPPDWGSLFVERSAVEHVPWTGLVVPARSQTPERAGSEQRRLAPSLL